MRTAESFGVYYHEKIDWLPETLKEEIGHFNISRQERSVGSGPVSLPFKRRHYYKIMLMKGDNLVQFADKKVRIKKQALAFLSPQIPYKWECRDDSMEGVYCVFNPRFFNKYYQFDQYEVFRLNGRHVFELNDEQYEHINIIFQHLEKEYDSDSNCKFDLIRNLILKLVHFGLKLEPTIAEETRSMNASQRISVSFLNMLEQQFRIGHSKEAISLRSPSEFAEKLNIHVNHLNRSMKETVGKSTSKIIIERILKESKKMLKNTSWNVADIAFALGFTEATHFNNFFKKHMKLSPLKFRNN